MNNSNLSEIFTNKLAVSPKEAAEASSISESKIRKDIRLGTLKTSPIGTRKVILVHELKRYLGISDKTGTETKPKCTVVASRTLRLIEELNGRR